MENCAFHPNQEMAEARRILRTGTEIKTCRHLPTYAQSGQPHAADHLRRRRYDDLQVEERSSPFTPLEEVLTSQDGSNERRVRIEDVVRHTMLLCGADAPPGRALRGNLVRELSKAITSEKGKKQKQGREGASQPHPEKSRLSHVVRNFHVCFQESPLRFLYILLS